MPRKTPDAESRRAGLVEQIALAEASLGDYAIAHERNPSDSTLADVERAEAELSRARRNVEIFDLAQRARSAEDVANAEAERTAKLAEIDARIKELQPQVEATAEKLISSIYAAGAEYHRLLRDLGTLRDAGFAAIRTAGGPMAIRRLGGVSQDGHDLLGDAVGRALAAAFSGGPALAGCILLEASNAFREIDLPQALAGLHERRMDLIGQAPKFLEAQK